MDAGYRSEERVRLSALAVLAAGQDLNDSPEDPGAADRLAATIEYRLADLSRVSSADFAPGSAEEERAADPSEVLGVVAAQLRIGEVALAAGGDDLPVALAGLRDTAAALEPATAEFQGFAARRVDSADLPAAVAAFRAATAGALDTIAARAADALARPVTTLGGLAPEQARKAWQQFTERAGLDGLGSRLVQLGIRAVTAALDTLHRLVRGDWVETARQKLAALAARLGAQGLAAGSVAWLLGVDAVSAEAEAVAGGPGAETARLDTASTALATLAGEFGEAMDKVALAQTALAGVGAVKLIGLAVPHLAAVLAGAELALGAVVVALALDYVDTIPGAGWVPGARTIIRAAVAP